MSVTCGPAKSFINNNRKGKLARCMPFAFESFNLDIASGSQRHGGHEGRAEHNAGRKRRARSYSELSPEKAQPRSRSRSRSSDDSYVYPAHYLRSGRMYSPIIHGAIEKKCDNRIWSQDNHADKVVSPKGICVFIPPSALKSLAKSKTASRFCAGNHTAYSGGNDALFNLDFYETGTIPRDNVEQRKDSGSGNTDISDTIIIPTGIPESAASVDTFLNAVSPACENQSNLEQSIKLDEIAEHHSRYFENQLQNDNIFPISPIKECNDNRYQETSFSNLRGNTNLLALYNTDIYRIGDNGRYIQENKNTNSGTTATPKKRINKDKTHHKAPRSHTVSPCSVKSNLSWEDNGVYDVCNYSACTCSNSKKTGSGVSKFGVTVRNNKEEVMKALQKLNKHHSMEKKQFWKRMAGKLEPNDIAIDVGRKSRSLSKPKPSERDLKPDLQEKSLDIKSHSSICKNNSSFFSASKCDVEASSKRGRSMGARPKPMGFVSPRGISLRASSSDDGSQRRHRQVPGRSKSPAAHSKGKAKTPPPRARSKSPATRSKGNAKTPPPRARSKSPGGRGVRIAQGSKGGAKGKAKTPPPRSVSKSPTPTSPSKASTSSRGSNKESKSKKGKKDKSEKKKAGSAKALDLDGIVPLTPAEICERCNKYRIDRELGECVPLDFSHVQHLERLAESVDEESTRQLLRTVTAIIEEKVCKQMFRCLMPCKCPGCINRPSICESLEQFLGGSPVGKKKSEENSEAKKKSGSKGKSGGGKGGKKQNKGSPKEAKQKDGTDSPKKGKDKGSKKSKSTTYESDEKSEKSAEVSDGVIGDSLAVPSLACCRGPSVCYYDKDCCCGRHGSHRLDSGWSSSFMRMGWWPGSRARVPHFDRCWSNRSGDDTAYLNGLRDDSWYKCERNTQGSNENAAIFREKKESNEAYCDNKRTCFTGTQNGRWPTAMNFLGNQENPRPGSCVSQSAKPMSDIFRHCGMDSANPCPHDGIKLSRPMSQGRSLTTPPFYADPSKVRDHFMAQPILASVPEQHSSAWASRLTYGDENSTTRLAALEKTLLSNSDNDAENDECKKTNAKKSSPRKKEPASRRRPSPRKRAKGGGSTSKNSSPTTAAIGEIEARTKALLCEAKLGMCQTNISGSDNSKSLTRDGFENSFLPEFSPIRPPDVNTAYSTNQSAQPVTGPEDACNAEQLSQSAGSDKQWWDGLPQKTTRVFNSVLLKKYMSNSAMPVSVEEVGKTQRTSSTRSGRGTKTQEEQGRSRSEPRLSQAGRKGPSTTRHSHHQDAQPDSARKTGSYTVCKGRPGKQNLKGKPAKKLWKY